jgi:hypothetical protein
MSTIQTRYAKSADVHIAYQGVGEGQVDLVMVNGWVTNLELRWEDPGWSAFFRRLASFSRLILFDKRGHRPVGSGVSPGHADARGAHGRRAGGDGRGRLDRGVRVRRLRGRPDERAVRRQLSGRTRGLVLYGSFPRITSSEDYP